MTDRELMQPDYSKAGFVKPPHEEGCAECGKKASDGWALYCVKCNEPVREWQGLTDDEIGDIIEQSKITLKNYCSEDKQTEYARAIEAALKAKNG